MRIDHTILGPICTEAGIRKCCEEVLKYGFKSICCNPSDVKLAKSLIKNDSKITTVIGFPHGVNTVEAKISEGINALENGADELDTVINFTQLRDNKLDQMLEEMTRYVETMRRIRNDVVVKYIIYIPYSNCQQLTLPEIHSIGKLVVRSGADFIKYSLISSLDIRAAVGDKVKLKHCFCWSLREMVYEIEKNKVDRFGHSLVPAWIEEAGPGFWSHEETP